MDTKSSSLRADRQKYLWYPSGSFSKEELRVRIRIIPVIFRLVQGRGSSTSSGYQLLLNGLVALPQELLSPLQDPVLGRDFCNFQALLLVNRVLAAELVHVLLELREESRDSPHWQQSTASNGILKKSSLSCTWNTQSLEHRLEFRIPKVSLFSALCSFTEWDQGKLLHCLLSQLTHLQAWDHSLLLATIWQLEK